MIIRNGLSYANPVMISINSSITMFKIISRTDSWPFIPIKG